MRSFKNYIYELTFFCIFCSLIIGCKSQKFGADAEAARTNVNNQSASNSANDISKAFDDPNWNPLENSYTNNPSGNSASSGIGSNIGGYGSNTSGSGGSTTSNGPGSVQGGTTSSTAGGTGGTTSTGSTTGSNTGGSGSGSTTTGSVGSGVGGQTPGTTNGGNVVNSGPNWIYFMDGRVPSTDCVTAQQPIYFDLVQTTSTGRVFSKTFDMNQIAQQFPRLLYIWVALDGARTNKDFWRVSLKFLGREYATAANDPNRPGDDLIAKLTKTYIEAYTSYPGPLVKFAHDTISLQSVFTMEAFLPPANKVTLQTPLANLYYCK